MSKISFKKYVNNIYKEQNDFLTNYKKMLFIDNDDSLTCLSIFDIEQYNKLRRPRILNDFINVIKEIKRDKNYCFFTITLKDINYKNLTDEEVLEYIKKQYKILKDFQTSIFKKRNDGRKNNLKNVNKILKYKLTKNNVLHLHIIIFYEEIEEIKTIYKRIKNYKNNYEKFEKIGRFELLVNDLVYKELQQFFKFEKIKIKNEEVLIDGDFKKGDFNYFKKLDNDENLIKYIYKYLTKEDKLENKIFKLLKIKKQTYSHNFFDGISQKDLKILNFYFYKIIKQDYKLLKKLDESDDEQEKEEIKFKLGLIEKKDNVSINIINRIKNKKIIIDKKRDKRNDRY